MAYDDAYKKIPDYFGTEPSTVLKDYYHLLDKARPVLDIGAGQGRNTLFLAREGFTVDAVEPSQVGVDIINRIAADEGLTIHTHCSDFENFDPGHNSYGAILLLGILQVLTWDAIGQLLKRVELWTTPGSHIIISAFGAADPGFEKIAAESENIGKNSFRIGDGNFRTFFKPGELLTLFANYGIIHYSEGMGPEHDHGGKSPHCHAVIQAVFTRPAP
jgi:2-polyprenyl-3-methyl-5-hydroxy-6-metoxy-1,4-benzoquinol methylase